MIERDIRYNSHVVNGAKSGEALLLILLAGTFVGYVLTPSMICSADPTVPRIESQKSDFGGKQNDIRFTCICFMVTSFFGNWEAQGQQSRVDHDIITKSFW